MKVGILLIAKGWSGAENAVYNLVNGLKKDIDVNLFINKEILNFYRKIKKIRLYNVGGLSNKLLFLQRYYKARRNFTNKINEEKITVITFFLGGSFIIGSKLFHNSGCKTIVTLRGEELLSLHKKNDFINNYFLKRALKYCSKIVVVSNQQINYIPKEYRRKVVYIPNGVDSKIFKSLKNIKQRKNIILFVGRFVDIKGIREIVNVAKQLPQYEFWFAGQGPLANLINLSNTKNLGFKSTEELVKLYNQATICIFPSHREAFGNVGLETMACGRAVIATPLGFSEYIENGKEGIIIPAKDENALKNAIINLMTNEKKRKLLEKNARKKALQHSWENVAKRYLRLFKELIE